MGINKALFTSNSEEWETPQDLFNRLNDEFNFTLDVCATEENHKCTKYFTKEQDGLMQEWSGEVVWCNPPYGRLVGEWVKRCCEHKGVSVMLLPARTDTKWFHDYIYGKNEIRFIRGRLKFNNIKNSAPFPSMIVIHKGAKGTI